MTWNILSSMNSSVSRCNDNVINIQHIHWPSFINYTIISKIVIISIGPKIQVHVDMKRYLTLQMVSSHLVPVARETVAAVGGDEPHPRPGGAAAEVPARGHDVEPVQVAVQPRHHHAPRHDLQVRRAVTAAVLQLENVNGKVCGNSLR